MEVNSSGTDPKDVWASGADYESYVGRWSRLVAARFVEWLDVPAGSAWLDVGCGTGALIQTALQAADPRAVEGIDAAQGYIDLARQRISDSRASFRLGQAESLPVESELYDAVVSGLVLNFIPDPGQAVAEMVRAAKPGGRVGVYVWDYAGKMQFMRHFWNAAAALEANAASLDEGRRFPLCSPGPLAGVFQRANLSQVEVVPIDIWTVFEDFDDYWLPFLGGQGPAPGYTASLNEEKQIALRERLRAALPFALDGSIPLVARAWAVRGIR